jgi:hypothetical protein
LPRQAISCWIVTSPRGLYECTMCTCTALGPPRCTHPGRKRRRFSSVKSSAPLPCRGTGCSRSRAPQLLRLHQLRMCSCGWPFFQVFDCNGRRHLGGFLSSLGGRWQPKLWLRGGELVRARTTSCQIRRPVDTRYHRPLRFELYLNHQSCISNLAKSKSEGFIRDCVSSAKRALILLTGDIAGG